MSDKILEFSPPDADAPGYLLRQRNALELYEEVQQNPSPAVMDALVEFLAQYVSHPEKMDDRKEVLYSASENQIKSLISAIVGGGENPTSPEETGKN